MEEAGRNRVASIPVLELTGAAEAQYVSNAVAILRSARLNTYYPDARLLAAHVGMMAPEVHRGLYPGLQIDVRSGLPTYREWTRIQTDAQIAEQALADLRPQEDLEERAKKAPRSIFGKQLLKHHYYGALRSARTAPLSHMDVALRRIDTTNKTAYFRVLLDKLDASGLFVRYTIDLGQQASVWSRAMVTLDKETADHTETLQSLIYKFTSLDAEFTFAKLVSLGNLVVERVVKGTVGPFFFNGVRTIAPLASALRDSGGTIATFALDTAATDLSGDRDNDPADLLLAAKLSEEARRTYEESKARYGFRVFKDRKFVVSSELVDAVRAYCTAAGTRNIVYPLPTSKRPT